MSSADMTDLTLVRLVANRDEAAFREFHSRYQHRIARFVSKAARRPDVVEEVTSDTLWTVWRSAGAFRGSSKVSTWVFGIASNLVWRSLRSATRQTSIDGFDLTAREELHDPWPESDAWEWLTEALAKLPPAQRTVLEMAYIGGHSCIEISDAVNCPVNTVKTRLFHARQKLRYLYAQG